jgi:UPF0716 family protein affecting phage T7 exclusion
VKPRSRYRGTWDIHAQGGQAYTFAELMIRIGLLPIIGFIWIALKIGFMPAMIVMLLLIIGLAGLCKLMKKKQGVR